MQNANTTGKIAEIEEQANLIYTAELIDRLSGNSSAELNVAVVCTELQDTTKYNYDIQLKTTDAPTVTGILVNPTEISIAQGDNTKSIEATPVVTAATGTWYAVVDGKYYRIYMPEGKKQIKIDRAETNVEGEGEPQQVTFTSNNSKVVFNTTGTTTTTINCNEQGKATVRLSVAEDATSPATITTSVGGKTADCTVTVLRNVEVTVQAENISDDKTVGTVIPNISKQKCVEGSTIELIATVMDDDYQFVGWYETKDNGTEGATAISTNAKYGYKVPSNATEVLIKAKFEEKPQTLGTSESGVGYYIKKGDEYAIVFADRLAQAGGTVTWSSSNTSSCTFPILTGDENLKTYVISNEEYTDPRTTANSSKGFGTHKVIKVTDDNEGTEDRFMAMALSDMCIQSHCWYYSAFSDSRHTVVTETGFNKGKTNTGRMITKWTNADFGERDGDIVHPDVWGRVREKYNQGWFVPSKDEWSAFTAYLKDNKGLTTSNYSSTFGLTNLYWSSSQNGSTAAWSANLINGRCGSETVRQSLGVRLATTF